ncbi:hypothetical protein QTN25_008699 [Entamoeba marina]
MATVADNISFSPLPRDVLSDNDQSEPSLASLSEDFKKSSGIEITETKAEERLEIENNHHDGLTHHKTDEKIMDFKESEPSDVKINMANHQLSEVTNIIEPKEVTNEDESTNLLSKISDAKIPLWDNPEDKKRVRTIRISFLIAIGILIVVMCGFFVVVGICI